MFVDDNLIISGAGGSIGGGGNSGYIAKWVSANNLGNSIIFDQNFMSAVNFTKYCSKNREIYMAYSYLYFNQCRCNLLD